jgi:RNA polymerase-interacting CarD/CdnL/TRCF family regulator
MQDRFAVGDRIDHPRFGIGVVAEVRPGKIDVKFGRELKTLIHGA